MTNNNQENQNTTHPFINNDDSCCTDSLDDFIENNDNKSNLERTIDKSSARKVVRYVLKDFKRIIKSEEFREIENPSTTMMNGEPSEIRHSQLELGRILGEGTFASVYSVSRFSSLPPIGDFCADQVVVKVLKREVADDASTFAACAAGLAKEGAILGALSHKNIIRMRAFSSNGLGAYVTGRTDSFFIVLDRLHEMLKDRIRHWNQINDSLTFSIKHRHQKFHAFLRERLVVAADLANAVAYLHKNRIIHRDIKPSNIGFDARGTLKVFDFDVSRVLPKESSDDDELFHLTMNTGTLRYMSPECGLTSPYNLKSDVYSFAIVFYEILSLERPFYAIMRSQHKDVVFGSDYRPRIHNSWPLEIKGLLKNAWSKKIKSRPSMSQIHSIISKEIKNMDRPKVPTKRWVGRKIVYKSATVGCDNQQ